MTHNMNQAAKTQAAIDFIVNKLVPEKLIAMARTRRSRVAKGGGPTGGWGGARARALPLQRAACAAAAMPPARLPARTARTATRCARAGTGRPSLLKHVRDVNPHPGSDGSAGLQPRGSAALGEDAGEEGGQHSDFLASPLSPVITKSMSVSGRDGGAHRVRTARVCVWLHPARLAVSYPCAYPPPYPARPQLQRWDLAASKVSMDKLPFMANWGASIKWVARRVGGKRGLGERACVHE